MVTQLLKIDSKAPGFPGFYNTIYEYSIDFISQDLYESYGYENVENVFNDSYLDDFIDYRHYEEEVCKDYVDSLNYRLKDYDILNEIEFEFEKVISPKEYNFYNDEIYCQLILKNGYSTITRIIQCLELNKADFDNWCKENYSSRSGFISFMPNSAEEFISNLRSFYKAKNFSFENGGKYLLEVIQFIIWMEDSGLYDDIYDDIDFNTHQIENFNFDYFESKLPEKVRKELQSEN